MYQNYDFDNDEKWKQFISQTDKSLSQERLEYLKQFWYKENVNKNEKVEVQKISEVKEESKLPHYIYSTENIFKMLFMLLLFMQSISQSFGYFFNCLALQRQLRGNYQKGKLIKSMISNEFFHNLLFLLTFHYFEKMHNLIFYSPLLMHAWVGISEFLFLNHQAIYEKMQRIIDKTKQNKEQIMILKNKFEIYILIILIGARFFDYGTWVLIIFYVGYLKIKFHISSRQQLAWKIIDQSIQSKLKNRLFIKLYLQIKSYFIYVFFK